MIVIANTAYLPNLNYLFYILNSSKISIEQFEFYEKQSFRNRTQIVTANGLLNLTIPVLNNHCKTLIKDKQISYKEQWQKQHWGAITSAYKNSPYFEFFEDAFKQFYTQKFESLLDFNSKQLDSILKLLTVKKEILFTNAYETNFEDKVDTRNLIHPKRLFIEDETVRIRLTKPYYQTFGDKHGFSSNLSCLDILFNIGLGAKDYLMV